MQGHRLQRDIFLRRLSKLMSNPVMPDDEPMDYLITQAIADYLATESKITFDGIMYPSVQVNNEHINVVLFYKSAKVFPITSTLKVDLGTYTDEGWEWSYSLKKGRVKSKKKWNQFIMTICVTLIYRFLKMQIRGNVL